MVTVSTIDRLVEQAEALPEDEKLALANRVLALAEPAETEEVHEAWDTELRERIRSYDEGKSPSRAARDVFRELDSKLTK